MLFLSCKITLPILLLILPFNFYHIIKPIIQVDIIKKKYYRNSFTHQKTWIWNILLSPIITERPYSYYFLKTILQKLFQLEKKKMYEVRFFFKKKSPPIFRTCWFYINMDVLFCSWSFSIMRNSTKQYKTLTWLWNYYVKLQSKVSMGSWYT